MLLRYDFKWLPYLVVIALTWDANTETDLVGYKVYARASTVSTFSCLTTLHKQTSARITVDGRRNWYFYVTARNKSVESKPSNIVYLKK
jgi:hypothetical protein